MSKFFRTQEFDSPDSPGSGRNMQSSTVDKMNVARAQTEKIKPSVVFKITSGYRTPEYNERIGGVSESAHTRGYAADIDISWMSEEEIAASMWALARAGFPRIGLKGGSFIHVDDDPDKPSPAVWDYSDADHKA